MESRTSPGKKGSVQPISECPGDAVPFFQAWVSRPAVPVRVCSASSALDEAVVP